jgi:hypothetical protein
MHLRASLLASLVLCTLAACGDDSGGGPDAATVSCTEYCDQIATNCSGALTQYTNLDGCLAICGSFDQGAAGAMSGNSLECRAYHAGAALGDPDTHCVHAGPGGAGVCGDNCEGFCTVVLGACTGANEAYASMAECMTACDGFADTEAFDVSDVAGDTLACRLYHASVATADPVTHCQHTLPVSATCN